jgi:hypothetical protein
VFFSDPDLQPGTSRIITTTVHVSGDLNVNASATADILSTKPAAPVVGPPVPQPPPPPAPKVQMDSVATPASAEAKVGDLVTIHYVITNDGTIVPTQYAFNPRVDGHAALVSAKPSEGSCAEANGMLCDFPRLPPGKQVSVDVVLKPTATGTIAVHAVWVPRPGATPLWAYFFSSGGEATINASERTTDLAAQIQTNRVVRVGTPFNARATVSNIGPDSAPTATLQLTLNGLQLRAIHGTAVTCSPDRRRCTLTNLASKQTTTLDLSLVSSHAGHASITVTVSSTGTDPQPTNNHATATVHISRKRG